MTTYRNCYFFLSDPNLKHFFDEAHDDIHTTKGPIIFGLKDFEPQKIIEIAKAKGDPIPEDLLNFDPDVPRPDYLRFYYNDIDLNGDNSAYHGCVFYPERGRIGEEANEIVTAQNQAYWSGGITAQREFLLVTDIKALYNEKYTACEIYWLLDHGYTWEPCSKNPLFTLFRPPQSLPEISIANYHLDAPEIKRKRTFTRLYGLEIKVLEARGEELPVRLKTTKRIMSATRPQFTSRERGAGFYRQRSNRYRSRGFNTPQDNYSTNIPFHSGYSNN